MFPREYRHCAHRRRGSDDPGLPHRSLSIEGLRHDARDQILQLIEAPGFLDQRDDPESVVRQMTQHELEARENQVEGRMKRKMLALRRLFHAGAAEVVIADGRNEHPVRDALAGQGTLIR